MSKYPTGYLFSTKGSIRTKTYQDVLLVVRLAGSGKAVDEFAEPVDAEEIKKSFKNRRKIGVGFHRAIYEKVTNENVNS
jgi:hypothetical protein